MYSFGVLAETETRGETAGSCGIGKVSLERKSVYLYTKGLELSPKIFSKDKFPLYITNQQKELCCVLELTIPLHANARKYA